MKNIIMLSAVAGAALLFGCQSGSSDGVSYSDISRNLTPELRGSTERAIDYDRNRAVVNNMNMRLLSDDWLRAWYQNKPSYLTPLPVTSTTGLPH